MSNIFPKLYINFVLSFDVHCTVYLPKVNLEFDFFARLCVLKLFDIYVHKMKRLFEDGRMARNSTWYCIQLSYIILHILNDVRIPTKMAEIRHYQRSWN